MSLEVLPGAVVKATLCVGQIRWDGELCDVLHVHHPRTGTVAECRSVWSPSSVVWVPVNERSVEVVAGPVPGVKS